VPANIVEGFGKRGKADKARFLNMAEGSLEECRYYLILAHDLGYGQTEPLMRTLEEVSRLLNAYATGDSGFWLLTSVFCIPKGYQGRSPWLVSMAPSPTGVPSASIPAGTGCLKTGLPLLGCLAIMFSGDHVNC
jgi:hypothetical protein